jgi:hypothetical protein
MNTALENRFFSKVIKTETCHVWAASKNPDGYGRFALNGKQEKAHRVSWMLANGDIPKGKMICHHCDNPSCVNPDHLFLGDQSDNMIDMHNKGRHNMTDKSWIKTRRSYAGELNPRAKFTVADVQYIRASELSSTELAKRYGVHRNQIYWIRQYKTWKNV